MASGVFDVPTPSDKPYVAVCLQEIRQSYLGLINEIKEFKAHSNRFPIIRRCNIILTQLKKETKAIAAFLHEMQKREFQTSDLVKLNVFEGKVEKFDRHLVKTPNFFHFDRNYSPS